MSDTNETGCGPLREKGLRLYKVSQCIAISQRQMPDSFVMAHSPVEAIAFIKQIWGSEASKYSFTSALEQVYQPKEWIE